METRHALFVTNRVNDDRNQPNALKPSTSSKTEPMESKKQKQDGIRCWALYVWVCDPEEDA